MVIEDKKVVGMEYTLTLDDGEIADSSDGKEPLFFLHGFGNIIPGLEKALEGLKVGDEKEVKVPPKEAYGEFNEAAFQEIPRDAIPSDVPLEEGIMLELIDENGYFLPAIIAEVQDEIIVVDMNHPLAGQTLNFKVKIVEIREATEEELEHGHVHGAHGH
jgi:FKBP-type peptidyl-prolyl cis-trans isomerase SlyD